MFVPVSISNPKLDRCWVFRAWGRVGTTIGGNKVESFGSKASAIEHFEEIFAEKTGNEWGSRKSFVKYPRKFYPLEIDYGDDDEEKIRHIGCALALPSCLPSSLGLVKYFPKTQTNTIRYIYIKLIHL